MSGAKLTLPTDLPAEDRVFHMLADALDAAGEDKRQLFLAKLALLLSLRINDQRDLERLIAIARTDL
jgi:hypothetical protein